MIFIMDHVSPSWERWSLCSCGYGASVESHGALVHQGNLDPSKVMWFQEELATFKEERNQPLCFSPAAAACASWEDTG